MASSALHNLSLLLIVAGLVLLITSLHLNRRAHAYRQRIRSLLKLTHQALEPLDIPAAAWPILADSGWHTLHWQGRWFGQPVAGHHGAPATDSGHSSPLVFELRSGEDTHLTLTLNHTAPRGETRLFAEHLARIFILLLESRLHARSEALSAALAERAHLSLYLQHDMRNLAQWVDWVSSDFAACQQDDELLAAARRLRDNAPLAQERARRLFDALGQRHQDETHHPVDLRPAILQAARMCGLEPALEGNARAQVAPALLARALDNLFNNLAKVWRETATDHPTMQLHTTPPDGQHTDHCELHFHCPWLPGLPPLPAEKIFEPFASGRPGGLGLGLYQARKSLRETGGDLLATATAQGIDFRLQFPMALQNTYPPHTP